MNNGILEKAVSSLGKGFDLTSDFKLKYCKGKDRLVMLNEVEQRELLIPSFGTTVKDVSVDIKCDKGDRTRYQSDILNFNQMSEFFNQKCSVPGKIPSGFFNAMFGFRSGSWAKDAANTKYLALDEYLIVLVNVHIDRYPLVLSDRVVKDVPSIWDPSALARFIETYGTHIIVGLSIGGRDAVLVRQDQSSYLGPSDLKQHLEELGDQMFTGTCNFFSSKTSREQRLKAPQAFNLFDPQAVALNTNSSVSEKDGITVICSKTGGNTSTASHCEWLETVLSMPDAVQFSFIPITSLLNGIRGKGFLSHAINLYLRYKPPISDLHYFLDFQTHKLWAPIHSDLPLGPTPNMTPSSPALHVNLVGPKLYVNTDQVRSGTRPVTGMRLYLEGIKCNRLAMHIQHLSNTPLLLENKIDDMSGTSTSSTWRGSNEASHGKPQYIEIMNRTRLTHICTAPVEYEDDPDWASTKEDVAFIVTGAQLHVRKQESKTVLHLSLLYSKVSGSHAVQSIWARGDDNSNSNSCSSESLQKSGLFSAISTSLSGSSPIREKKLLQAVVVDSSVFPSGPPLAIQAQKLLKYVDLSELCKGPLDSPGYWLVTGARLALEKGKIRLHVKFSLLNSCS